MAVNRPIGTLHPTDQIPMPPDTVTMIQTTGASSAQAVDMPSQAAIMRITAMTTLGAGMGCFVNLFSTMAQVAAAGTTNSSAASSGVSHPVLGQGSFQLPSASTGWSVACISPGYVLAEYWHK